MALRNERFVLFDPVPTVSSKEALRRKTAADIERYLAAGGKITQCASPGSTPETRSAPVGFLDGKPAVSRVKRVYDWNPKVQMAVELLGGHRRAAMQLGVSVVTVRKWAVGEHKMPLEQAKAIESLTDGKVRADQLPHTGERA